MQAGPRSLWGTLTKMLTFIWRCSKIACVIGDAMFRADNLQAVSNKFTLFHAPDGLQVLPKVTGSPMQHIYIVHKH